MKLGFSPLFLEYFSIFLRFFSEFFDQIFFTQNAQNGLKKPPGAQKWAMWSKKYFYFCHWYRERNQKNTLGHANQIFHENLPPLMTLLDLSLMTLAAVFCNHGMFYLWWIRFLGLVCRPILNQVWIFFCWMNQYDLLYLWADLYLQILWPQRRCE